MGSSEDDNQSESESSVELGDKEFKDGLAGAVRMMRRAKELAAEEAEEKGRRGADGSWSPT